MASPFVVDAFIFLLATAVLVSGSASSSDRVSSIENPIRLPSEFRNFTRDDDRESGNDGSGIRWAVLIAGSNGYWNYRHQADVCHAYQVLKKGGLKEENIVVFMYDDIAFHVDNPRPGVIINSPYGGDVYEGVPKDYTGENVTVSNFFAVLLGNRTALSGGSGKVVDSGPDDRIFVYYSDHGGPGVLGFPTSPYLYANDLITVLKKKHASGTYKSLVFYVEACESGSIFEGLLPEGLNIYVTTASNAEESSWGTYCPGEYPGLPDGYDTCLGDLYSVSWMEDSDLQDLKTETLHQQYELVRRRTANKNSPFGSHVMQYGDIKLSLDDVFLYIGSNPANENRTPVIDPNAVNVVSQRDADLAHFWHKYVKSPEGSLKKTEAHRQLMEAMVGRDRVDATVGRIASVLLGNPAGGLSSSPIVRDWECLKAAVQTYETHCGPLSHYAMKHTRSFAGFCNAGIRPEEIAEASQLACASR